VFENLTEALSRAFRKLTGKGVLSEKNIEEGLREVRQALLSADVNFRVVKDFVESVKQKALGQEVIKSVRPEQQIVKVVFDEMVKLMGPEYQGLSLKSDGVSVIMMVGLQGSGKTTTCAKLANYLRKKNRRVLLVAADIRRPAAIEQLEILGRENNFTVYSDRANPAEKICADALSFATKNGFDTAILDTAGRLHIDDEMMAEVERVSAVVKPDEILFVTDAMTGQDAVNSAKAFNERLSLTGVILTKMDGDARGGAAMSVKAVTGKPIKFIGTGEQVDKFEEFHPDRIASRILGMGDVVSLVERAQLEVSEEEARKMQEKLLKEEFTFEDFLKQLGHLKKMGGLKETLSLLPGIGQQLSDVPIDEKDLLHIEAMIYSMTEEERTQPELVINSVSRRLRIAKGSGVSLKEVNDLCKQFESMRKVIRQFKRMGFFGKVKMALGLGKGMLQEEAGSEPAPVSVAVARDESKMLRLRKREERKKKKKLLKKQKRRQK